MRSLIGNYLIAGLAVVLGVVPGLGQDQIPIKEGVGQRFDQPSP